MNIQSKIAAGATTGVVILSMVATSTFAAGATIKNNLKNSFNIATQNNNNMVLVGQSNNAFVVVGVNNNNSTGGNKSNDNLSGGQTVKSGNANSNTNINVGNGTNVAALPACGCSTPGDATVIGNGKNSFNIATVNNNSFTGVSQSNSLVSITSVTSNNSTGGNKSNDNFGGGQTVHSGDANSNTNINVGGGTNVLLP